MPPPLTETLFPSPPPHFESRHRSPSAQSLLFAHVSPALLLPPPRSCLLEHATAARSAIAQKKVVRLMKSPRSKVSGRPPERGADPLALGIGAPRRRPSRNRSWAGGRRLDRGEREALRVGLAEARGARAGLVGPTCARERLHA